MKYLILLPLMLLMLTYVACSEEPAAEPVDKEASMEAKLMQLKLLSEDGISPNEEEEIKRILSDINAVNTVVETEEISTKPEGVSFEVIEDVPVFPGCGELSSNEARKACMTQKITEFVNSNFDTSLGKELGLEGINKIYVQFRINTAGNIEVLGIRAPHPALKAEAERLITSLPQMEPGRQNGQEINVLYALPIAFKVGE